MALKLASVMVALCALVGVIGLAIENYVLAGVCAGLATFAGLIGALAKLVGSSKTGNDSSSGPGRG